MRSTQIAKYLRPLENLGHLVDSNSSTVPIVRSGAPNNGPQPQKKNKLAPETESGLNASPRMVRLPQTLAKRVSSMTIGFSPQEIRQRVAQLYGSLQAGDSYIPAIERLDVEAQITGLFLQNYASLRNALSEVNKRVPQFKPENVLDVGFGPATGILAAREVFGVNNFNRETGVIIGHPRMKQRATELLGNTETTRFRYDIPSVNTAKKYDLIIAQHQMFQQGQFAEELVASHVQQLAQLLEKNGVIVLVERGDPNGFEAVALAREHLLRAKFGFNVVGPCLHNKPCPLQLGLERRMHAKNPGKENWCRFSQQVERPKYVMELKKGQYLAQQWVQDQNRGSGGKSLKGTGRPFGTNHESATFSWVALQNPGNKSTENKNELSSETIPELGRIMKQPMKRHGHVTMEVCSSNGDIEHWTIPRSQGKQAYHDARKACEADVWSLGAKTRQKRGGIRENSQMAPARSLEEIRKLPLCSDWWSPQVNPHFKFSSHQARISHENNEESDDSFLSAMDSLIEDDGRFDKLLRKQLQKRFRK